MNTQDIQKAFKGKKDFHPSKKLQKMMKVKKLFIIDEAHAYFNAVNKCRKIGVEPMVVTQSINDLK
jgi:hypothetical protein